MAFEQTNTAPASQDYVVNKATELIAAQAVTGTAEITAAVAAEAALRVAADALKANALSAALVTPVVDGVTYSVLNKRQIITTAFAITGTALHAANLTAVTFPAAAIIIRAWLDITTVSTGAATIDIGYTAVSATTAASDLFTNINVNDVPILHDTQEESVLLQAIKAASGKWITVHEDADTTGLVATLYVQFILA